MSRLKLIGAVALSLALVGGLVASLLSGDGTPRAQTASPASGQEFFGIIQGIRLDEQDFQTMEATGVGSNRFQLVWGVAQPSRDSFSWGPTDALVGGVRVARNPAGPVRVGVAAVGRGHPRPTRRSTAREDVQRVAELPQGGGGALRTGRQLLDERLPPAVRRGRHAAADPVLADLERAQPGEVLRAEAIRRAVRPAAQDLARRDQAKGSAGPDRPRGHARLRGHQRLGLPRRALFDARDQAKLRRRRPAPVRARPRTSSAGRSSGSAR